MLRCLAFLFLSCGCVGQLWSCPLEGYWRSDAERTLSSFRQAQGVSEKQKELFENNFFGKLYMHIECERFTAVMEGWHEITEYERVTSSDEVVVIKFNSEIEGEVVRKAVIEGACYSLAVNEGQFKEYFCPITKREFLEARASVR